jgi:hypothetical protein
VGEEHETVILGPNHALRVLSVITAMDVPGDIEDVIPDGVEDVRGLDLDHVVACCMLIAYSQGHSVARGDRGWPATCWPRNGAHVLTQARQLCSEPELTMCSSLILITTQLSL